jgi:hypothetical protein
LNEDAIELENCLRELNELCESVAPLSIDFRNVIGVKLALENMRQRKLEQTEEQGK